ncbi:MAG: O-antigen ligase family protein [Deinococcota bacterium]
MPKAVGWPRWWLAGLPFVYVLSPLAILGNLYLRQLPAAARLLLLIYAASQLLPALVAPDAAMATLLALGRTVFVTGLVGIGAQWGSTREVRWLGLGLGLTYALALGFSLLEGTDLWRQRLAHPYMTSVSLGLAGSAGLWLAAYAPGLRGWRWPLSLLALTILLLSGSRGALLAALLGLLAGALLKRWRAATALFVVAALGLLAFGLGGGQTNVAALDRLRTTDGSGRDVVWSNTLSVVQAYPWTGAGPYQLGRSITVPGEGCELFPSAQGDVTASCPAWLERLRNPWIIAHNGSLHQLAESGPLGLGGWALLFGTAMVVAVQRRDALGAAVLVGLTVANLNDNTTLVPSPFFAEVFWIVAGVQLRHLTALRFSHGAVSALLLAGLSWPVLSAAWPIPAERVNQDFGLAFLYAPTNASPESDYAVLARFAVPPGTYRASLNACTATCALLETRTFTVLPDQPAPTVRLVGRLWPDSRQRLELRLLSGQAGQGGRLGELARHTWFVEGTP